MRCVLIKQQRLGGGGGAVDLGKLEKRTYQTGFVYIAERSGSHGNMRVSVLVCWKSVSDLSHNPRRNDQHISTCQELPSCYNKSGFV